MADNDSIAKKFARVLADPESNNTEVAEARTALEILMSRGSIYAREVLAQFPAVQVYTETERPVLGASPELAAILAGADEAMRAARVEHERLAKVRSARRAELEAAFTSHGTPTDWQYGYRRSLEVYQSGCYSFAEETLVFEGMLSDIATRWKNVSKRV